LGPDHVVGVVVAVGPSLCARPLAFLHQVAFSVIAVRPGSIVGQLICRAGLVTSCIAVAVQVVAIGTGRVAGELIGGIVLICGGRAVKDFCAQTICEIVRVRIVGQ